MSLLENIERVDREIFKVQNNRVLLTVNNTLLTGKKGSNDIKLDPIYKRSYPSQKYSDKSELETIKLSSSDYITFSYNDFENKKNEEIFISYPNLYDLKDFCNECMNLLDDENTFTKKNEVSANAKDIMITSNEFASGKVLVMIPSSIERDQNLERGMYLFVNEEDYYVELEYKSMYTLNEIVQNIDLLTLSNQTLILGILSNIGGDSISSESSSSSRAPKSPLSNRPKPPFKRSGNQFGRRPSPSSQQNDDEEEATIEEAGEDVFDNNEEDVKPTTPKKTTKSTSSKLKGRTVSKKTSPVTNGSDITNFNNLMNEANKIEFNADDEDDVDFEE